MVTVRKKVTGVISMINLSDLDETVELVVPDVTPPWRAETKDDIDRAIRREIGATS